MIEIEKKPELRKRVYCTRPDLPKWTNKRNKLFSSDKCVTFHENRFNLKQNITLRRNWLSAIRANYAFGNPGFGNSGRHPRLSAHDLLGPVERAHIYKFYDCIWYSWGFFLFELRICIWGILRDFSLTDLYASSDSRELVTVSTLHIFGKYIQTQNIFN